MSRIALVTALRDDEPFAWGLDLRRVALPMVVRCPPARAAALGSGPLPAHVRVVAADVPDPLTPRDRLVGLAAAAAEGAAERHYWVDVELLYRHLSFEFLYSDLLARALDHCGSAAVYLAMPGYPPASFFGGPSASLAAVLARLDGDAEALFDTAVGGRRPGVVFRPAFGHDGADLNLALARVLDAPAVHVIGDSHVLNCFTPNGAIGCRANVLVRSGDVSAIAVPYHYHFSHHLGGRTMHHAGGPGALLAIAEQCGVRAGDAAVWVFGEIDVRCHVVRRQRKTGQTLDAVVDTLARDYVGAVAAVGARLAPARQVVFAPIPPLDNPDYASVDLPVHGSIEERIAATRRLGAALQAHCDRHGLDLLDVGDDYRTARGDLRWELSDRFCHVASGFQGPIIDALYRLLAS